MGWPLRDRPWHTCSWLRWSRFLFSKRYPAFRQLVATKMASKWVPGHSNRFGIPDPGGVVGRRGVWRLGSAGHWDSALGNVPYRRGFEVKSLKTRTVELSRPRLDDGLYRPRS